MTSKAMTSIPASLKYIDDYDIDNDYEYDYDLEVSANHFDWYELGPVLIVYGLTFLIGLTGNFLVIFTISVNRRMKTTTNLFLASLAYANILLILCCIPVKMVKMFLYSWTFGAPICKMVHYVQATTALCSGLTLTAISVERYRAIALPTKVKQVWSIDMVKAIIAAVWVMSLFLATPMLRVQITREVTERTHHPFWCVRDWESWKIWRAHELYMFVLILLLPALIMSAYYGVTCSKVMKHRSYVISGNGTSQLESNGHSPYEGASNQRIEDHQTVKQVIKMLMTVVVLFLVCWGPMLVDNLLTAWGVLPETMAGSLRHMRTAFHLMAYANSCMNPIVYGFMSKSFRQSFRSALTCSRRPEDIQPSNNQTSSTVYRNTGFDSLGD